MPQVACPKCNGVISSSLRRCPHCGARIRHGSGAAVGLALGLLVLGGAVTLVVTMSGRPKQAAPPQMVSIPPGVAPPVAEEPAPEPAPAAPQEEPPPPEPVAEPQPQLVKGMTMQEVRQMLGEPTRESSAEAVGTRFDWWHYPSGEKLRFINSVLDSWTVGEPSQSAGVLAALGAAPPGGASAGASTEARKRIYAELKIAEKRAEVENSISGSRVSQKEMLEQIYAKLVCRKYGISEGQGLAILSEGDRERWPLPPVVFGPPLKGGPVAVGSVYTTGMVLELLLAPDTGGPLQNVEDSVTLPFGSRVHVLRTEVSHYTTWYYVEVLTPSGGVAGRGWLYGLVTLQVGAPAEPAAPSQPLTG